MRIPFRLRIDRIKDEAYRIWTWDFGFLGMTRIVVCRFVDSITRAWVRTSTNTDTREGRTWVAEIRDRRVRPIGSSVERIDRRVC